MKKNTIVNLKLNNMRKPYPKDKISTEEKKFLYGNIREKKESFLNFCFLNNRLSPYLRELENKLNQQELKRELFKIFYWNNLIRGIGRLNRFFFLLIFDIFDKNTNKSSVYKGPLVLCWDICTTKISFMFKFNINESGSEFMLLKNLFSSKEIVMLKEYGVSKEKIDENQARFSLFVDSLICSGILDNEKKVLDIITKKYSGAFLNKEIRELNFFVRSGQVIELGKENTPFAHLSHSVCGQDSVAKQSLQELNECLLDLGCPSFQIVKNIDTQGITYSENQSNNPIFRAKSIDWIRKFYSCSDGQRFYFSEEPSSYQSFVCVE